MRCVGPHVCTLCLQWYVYGILPGWWLHVLTGSREWSVRRIRLKSRNKLLRYIKMLIVSYAIIRHYRLPAGNALWFCQNFFLIF